MEQDITTTRGDTFNRTVKFTTPSGAVNITGSAIVFSLKTSIDDTTAYYSKALTITNATGGEASLTIPHSDSEDFAIGNYFYDIQWTDSNGNVKTVVKGIFTVTYDVTA